MATGGAGRSTLTLAERQEILAENDRFAAQGLRVLGIAHRYWSALPAAESVDTSEQELIWLGLVGILDPLGQRYWRLLPPVAQQGFVQL